MSAALKFEDQVALCAHQFTLLALLLPQLVRLRGIVRDEPFPIVDDAPVDNGHQPFQ